MAFPRIVNPDKTRSLNYLIPISLLPKIKESVQWSPIPSLYPSTGPPLAMVNYPFLNKSKLLPPPSGELSGGYVQECYEVTVLNEKQTGVWLEINPSNEALTAFITQLVVITFLTKFLVLVLRPLKQPAIVAQIIAGTLLGPSFMGKLKKHSSLLDSVFSISGVMTLEAMGNIGLVYFLFLLGLEIDLTKVTRVGQKALYVALAGTIFPFLIGTLLYYLLLPDIEKAFKVGCFFWGVALTDSSLSVATQILAKLKLLYTDIGKIFMSSAVVNEIISWIFLTFLLAIGNNVKKAPLTLVSIIGFFIFCLFAIRPVFIRMIDQNKKNGELNEQTTCIILTMVLACGLVTDLLGTSSIIGAFAFGLVLPSGLLGPKFVAVVRGFAEEILLPIYFATVGFRTNFHFLTHHSSWELVVLIVVLAYLSKILSSLAVSFYYRTYLKEGIALGVLMNTKGLLSIIVLNFARDFMVIEDQAFSVLLITLLVMTMATEPIISLLYRPQKFFLSNNHRAIQKLTPGSAFKVLACVHEAQSVNSITNLLEACYPCIQSPLIVFALHLIELTSDTSALLLIHGSDNTQADQIHEAFCSFEKDRSCTLVEQQTVVSDYATMHVDICSIAEYKRASCIIIPFHKRQTIHDSLENMSQDYKDVNDNLLLEAPCSVAIFVDRGFGRFQEIDAECENVTQQIAMVFLGGPDDREALSFARKMGAHPNLVLTVVRLVENKKQEAPVPGVKLIDMFDSRQDLAEVKMTIESRAEQKLMDDSFIDAFRRETAEDGTVAYMEKEASNGVDIIGVLRVLVECYDLFIVGRGVGAFSSSTAGLEEGSECPELGPIGDLLVTSTFSSSVSVLVVQQYKEPMPNHDGTWS